MLLAPGYGTVITRTVRTLAQQMAAVVALAPIACGRVCVTASPHSVASPLGRGARHLANAGTWRLGTAMLSAAAQGPHP